MKKIKKFFYVVHDIITIILVIALFVFIMGGKYSNDFINYLLRVQSIRYTLAVLTCIVALISFVKLVRTLLKKREDRYLLLFRDDGDVEISDLAIEKIVLNSMAKFREIVEEDVKIKIKNGQNEDYRVIIDIECGLDEDLLKKDVLVNTEVSSEDDSVIDVVLQEKITEETSVDSVHIDKESIPDEVADNGDKELENNKEASQDEEVVEEPIKVAEDGYDYVEEELISSYEDQIYRQIQSYIHRNIVAFLGVKIDRVGIKFYYTKRKNSSNRKHYEEKKKRVK